ncbi:c-type cytochrome [Pseudomonas seleniipraecipitans]|uniref:C-type cytochrome n=1 Tax=Phytopseudomonas seleniipraecipitans TaxID=640205 RepID=A0ABY5J557_9GAMM|nr:c-type cytochrome [Pseudomonas seleniipraecipitans]UUD63017.1 c-type cytochrome [Pseudomonas seleniipraecipitans]
MNPIKSMLVVPAMALALWVVNAQATTDEAIAERIKPVGQVCIAGQQCTGVEAVSAAPATAARSADDIVARHCTACHTPGLLGAPKIGDSAAWKARADEQGGMDGILAKAIEGINAMPPKGTCGDCSDDELRAAIEKMSGL